MAASASLALAADALATNAFSDTGSSADQGPEASAHLAAALEDSSLHWVVITLWSPYSQFHLECLAGDPSISDMLFADPEEFVKTPAQVCLTTRETARDGLT